MRTFGQLPIRGKMTLLVFGIVFFTFIMIGIIVLGYVSEVKEEGLAQKALITSQNVAQHQVVREKITSPDAADYIQPIAERARALQGVDYVVVLNMDRTRLSHPIPDRLHTTFESTDADAAFSEHVYTSKAQADGTFTVRAFVPVMNEDYEQVGVVVSGHMLPSLLSIMSEFRHATVVTFIITMLFGFWGAWMLANHIKKQTFQMEPEDLARVLVERTATFHAIHEGVIAIDEQQRITVINHAAKEMLGLKEDPVGQLIYEAIPDTRLPEVLKKGEAMYQKDFYVQNRAVFSNRIPIRVNERTVGAVAIFQDKTEVNRLAEELTGVQSFVDALRVQNHEYSNKLHTIAGLIQMDEGEKALEFIYGVTDEQNKLSRVFTERIHDDSIAGLLIGKVSRGKELGIHLHIDENSQFEYYPEGIHSHDIVVILGNLIDNSFDALENIEKTNKKVSVLVKQMKDQLVVKVSDNGTGIEQDIRERMFERGFSTKANEGRGIGMYLIQSIVDRVEGDLDVETDTNGTIISIMLPMQRRGRKGDGKVS